MGATQRQRVDRFIRNPDSCDSVLARCLRCTCNDGALKSHNVFLLSTLFEPLHSAHAALILMMIRITVPGSLDRLCSGPASVFWHGEMLF